MSAVDIAKGSRGGIVALLRTKAATAADEYVRGDAIRALSQLPPDLKTEEDCALLRSIAEDPGNASFSKEMALQGLVASPCPVDNKTLGFLMGLWQGDGKERVQDGVYLAFQQIATTLPVTRREE